MNLRSFLVLGLSALSLSVGAGCSGSAEGADDASEGALEVGERPAYPVVTAENYMSHPAIVEIRKIVQDIDASLGRLKKTERRDLCSGGAGDDSRVAYKDGDAWRKIETVSGNDGSMVTASFYYEKDVLRFAFRDVRSIHPVAHQDRYYFDDRGMPIISLERDATGDETHEPDIKNAKDREATAEWPLFGPEATFTGPAKCN